MRCRVASVTGEFVSAFAITYYPVNPLPLRGRVGERGSDKKQLLDISPLPGPLPEGEGTLYSSSVIPAITGIQIFEPTSPDFATLYPGYRLAWTR